MNKLKARFFSALLLPAILCPDPALCCTLAVKPPIMSFDTNEFVFTGKVTKLVGPFSTKMSSTTYGVEAIVDQPANLPTPAKSYLVFKFRHSSMCGPVLEGPQTLQKLIGHQFRFVAKPLSLIQLEGQSPTSPALQITSIGREILQQVENGLDKQLPVTLDYRKIADWTGPYSDAPKHWYAIERAGYDLRVELLRLKENGVNGRTDLVARMAYHPQFIDKDPTFALNFIRNNLNEPDRTKVLNGFDGWAVKRFRNSLDGLKKTPGWQYASERKRLLGYLDSMKTQKSKAAADKYRAKGE